MFSSPHPAGEFVAIDANLRESFRVLVPGRPDGEFAELAGVSIVSLGVAFQMFNAAFISAPVKGAEQLAQRLNLARAWFNGGRFGGKSREWSLWVCEDWLDRAASRQLARLCQSFGLRPASEVPGMIAPRIEPRSRRALPSLEYHPVSEERTLTDFNGIGNICFNVPAMWYREVFDSSLPARPFVAWVGYLDGCPVATSASVTADGVIGVYNVATAPAFRGRGFGEAITRHTVSRALEQAPGAPIVLQTSAMGLDLYLALGFHAVTRFLVYNS